MAISSHVGALGWTPPDCEACCVFYYTNSHGIDSFKFMQAPLRRFGE
jgi:hypothetical protein